MIEFKGFEKVINEVYRNGQEQVFACWDDLNEQEKIRLLEDIADVDFALLKQVYDSIPEASEDKRTYSCAPYISQKSIRADAAMTNSVRKMGEEAISSGKVAVFVVAGGQGSRLGFSGPKGVIPFSPVKNKTLFRIHAEKIRKFSLKYKTQIPFLIMTSEINHEQTVSYFEDNDYFSLGKDNVFIFPQKMIPSLDKSGKLILESKGRLFRNPDGHGGSLTVLRSTGLLDRLRERGIETISYFQVDNPLVKILDPLFIGYHAKYFADISSKALIKTDPEEKIGLFTKYEDARMGIVEYSDLSKEKKYQRNPDGTLVYSAGNLAIHLFDLEFLENITVEGGSAGLPFHVALKKIKAFIGGSQIEIEGYKFEKFVFDALPLTDRNIVVETYREDEFAPIKNKSGDDSIESARVLYSNVFRKWLVEKGVAIPERVKWIEISPLTAVEADDLPADISIPDEESVYL